MPTTTSATHPLVKRHADLVAKYGVTHGAPKAQISRQIIETELDLTLEQIDFDAWVKPSTFTRSWTMSEAELRDQIRKLRELIDRSDVADVIRAAADRRLQRYLQQSERRGVQV